MEEINLDKYSKKLKEFKIAFCNFNQVKSSSALGQGGARFVRAEQRMINAWNKLEKERNKLSKKNDKIKELFDSNECFISEKKILNCLNN